MSESLVVIRTFGAHAEADDAQVELIRAGIHSLLFTDEATTPRVGHSIALAVHSRDAHLAEAVLAPKPKAV